MSKRGMLGKTKTRFKHFPIPLLTRYTKRSSVFFPASLGSPLTIQPVATSAVLDRVPGESATLLFLYKVVRCQPSTPTFKNAPAYGTLRRTSGGSTPGITTFSWTHPRGSTPVELVLHSTPVQTCFPVFFVWAPCVRYAVRRCWGLLSVIEIIQAGTRVLQLYVRANYRGGSNAVATVVRTSAGRYGRHLEAGPGGEPANSPDDSQLYSMVVFETVEPALHVFRRQLRPMYSYLVLP